MIRNFPAHWIIALLAGLAVALTIDPADTFPSLPAGPGLTVDEIFNVELGVLMWDSLFRGDPTGFARAAAELPDHPPLGRFWLGFVHEVVLIVLGPAPSRSPLVVAYARFGSAVAYALLIAFLGGWSSRTYGRTAGWGTALSLALMPRVFAHAHLASLETVLNLTWILFVLDAVRWSDAPPTNRRAALTGVLYGLLLLTKIQGVLLSVPFACWALWTWRKRAVRPLAIWAVVAFVVFVAGWPWLWTDTLAHLREFLGRAADRSVVWVWYAGQKWADRGVPWHYPWVIFLVTIPVGLQVLAAVGLYHFRTAFLRSPREQWLLAAMLTPLVVFSIPGVAVYDGERLFLVVYPLYALWAGRGIQAAWEWMSTRLAHRTAVVALSGFLALQGIGLVRTHPCQLSYYSLLTGGLGGAERLGLQTTYWGDCITRELLRKTAEVAPAGSTVDFAPVLHQFQLPALESQSRLLLDRKISLRAYDSSAPQKYLLAFLRREYLPADWHNGPPGYTCIAEVRVAGVRLAGLFERNTGI